MPAYAEQPVPIAFEDVNGHLNVELPRKPDVSASLSLR